MRDKDVSDDQIFAVVDAVYAERETREIMVSIADFEAALPGVPARIIRAQCQSMVRRGLLAHLLYS